MRYQKIYVDISGLVKQLQAASSHWRPSVWASKMTASINTLMAVLRISLLKGRVPQAYEQFIIYWRIPEFHYVAKWPEEPQAQEVGGGYISMQYQASALLPQQLGFKTRAVVKPWTRAEPTVGKQHIYVCSNLVTQESKRNDFRRAS